MVDQELLPLVYELCHIADRRNKINARRHRARSRRNYYANALRVLRAHSIPTIALIGIKTKADHNPYKKYEGFTWHEIDHLITQYPNPKKWKKMGLSQIRSLILKNEGEYVLAKHETMELTIATRERVRFLAAKLDCYVRYGDGSIKCITFTSGPASSIYSIDMKQIERYSVHYELTKAMEKMVEE